jgi:hypothetical protein
MERSITQVVVGVAIAAVGVYILKAQPGGAVYGWGLLLLGSWYAVSVHPLIWDGLLDINTWTRGSTGVGDDLADGIDVDVDDDD